MSKVSKRSFSRALISVLSVAFFLIFSVSTASAQADAEAGEKLFKANCASCHKADKKLVGPALKGSRERWIQNSTEENMYEWVRNSQALVKAGEPYATELFNEYNSIMTAMPALSNEDIDNILEYVETYVPEGPVGPTGATGLTEGAVEEEATPWWVWLLIMVGLFMLVGVLRSTNYQLRKAKAEKDGKSMDEQPNFWDGTMLWMAANKRIVAIIAIVFLVLGTKDIAAELYEVGVYDGYQPEQPIAFSHKIHAGEDKIDCNYCHSSARHSKHAGIPSANVCMNCHKAIQEGPSGTEEIQKIYDAVGFDPEKGEYIAGYEQKPIKWVKVHNLPDHVYFNHSQHVTVGKIQCEKCHGEVKELTVGKQQEPLTMGWCVNCHRETKVNMEGNAYYDEIHKRLPDNLKAQYMKDGKITVSELGGIECGKCHY